MTTQVLKNPPAGDGWRVFSGQNGTTRFSHEDAKEGKIPEILT
jgi:hypothetical protein